VRQNRTRWVLGFLLFLPTLVFPGSASADEVRIAVAANFSECLKDLSGPFQVATGNEVVPIVGSTGRHFAQISTGAPFDIFLAADRRHPQLLVESGLGESASCFTYAIGRLVLWVSDSVDDPEKDLGKLLAGTGLTRVAMANPRLAPYGEAARQTLAGLELPANLAGRIILGTSVGQTWQFAATGNTEAAFVALSQTKNLTRGRVLIVPSDLHDPIEQQAVLLTRAGANIAARSFLEFLASPAARQIIHAHGYLTIEQED
jgi:molybdate transport system substrate-binding protein